MIFNNYAVHDNLKWKYLLLTNLIKPRNLRIEIHIWYSNRDRAQISEIYSLNKVIDNSEFI